MSVLLLRKVVGLCFGVGAGGGGRGGGAELLGCSFKCYCLPIINMIQMTKCIHRQEFLKLLGLILNRITE